jgi:GNAT superfamily N-acetyltransferase
LAKVIVAELDGMVVGTLQFHLLPSLSNLGRPTAEVEAVHVAEAFRGRRIGEALIAWAAADPNGLPFATAWDRAYAGRRPRVFSDDFEAGTTCRWSAVSSLEEGR